MNGLSVLFRRGWPAPVLLLSALIASYWATINGMVTQWLQNDDFSHGLLIVPISVWLAWERRGRLGALPRRVDWRAFGLLVAAVGLYVVGELGAELFTTRAALLLFVIGLVWLLYGWARIRALCFPLLFLFLMLPLPGFIYRNITFPLQILSSKWAVVVLQLAGVMAFREGNVIDLGFTSLQVVEACNGLRFILPLFTLGVLFAFWKPKALWKRLVLVTATVPIAIFANILRIGGTGILSRYWGPQAAEGFFHGFSGWVVFMISFALFFLLNAILGRLPGKAAVAAADSPPAGTQAPPDLLRPMLAALVLILITPPAVQWLGAVPPRTLKQPLSQFPLPFEGRHGKPQTMEAEIWERVGGQSYFMADYHREGEVPLNFYTAYYEYQRKGGDFIHSPKLCLPGAGWFVEHSVVRTIPYASETGRALRFNELLIRKGGDTQMVYYWHQGRGRNLTSEYAAKLWMVWDGIFRRRTDGALVRLVMNVPGEARLESVRRTMDAFALAASRELDAFLP